MSYVKRIISQFIKWRQIKIMDLLSKIDGYNKGFDDGYGFGLKENKNER